MGFKAIRDRCSFCIRRICEPQYGTSNNVNGMPFLAPGALIQALMATNGARSSFTTQNQTKTLNSWSDNMVGVWFTYWGNQLSLIFFWILGSTNRQWLCLLMFLANFLCDQYAKPCLKQYWLDDFTGYWLCFDKTVYVRHCDCRSSAGSQPSSSGWSKMWNMIFKTVIGAEISRLQRVLNRGQDSVQDLGFYCNCTPCQKAWESCVNVWFLWRTRGGRYILDNTHLFGQ